MRGGEGDQSVDLPVTAQPLDVVAGDEAAQGVGDDMHVAAVARRGRHRGGEHPGAVLDGGGPQRQLDRPHPAKAPAA